MFDTKSSLSPRMTFSRLEGGTDDLQHLLDIITNQHQALEERGETIRSLHKDLTVMGQMLLEERTKAARYAKLFGIAEKQLQSYRRKKPLSRKHTEIDPNSVQNSTLPAITAASPTNIKPTRKILLKSNTVQSDLTRISTIPDSPSSDFIRQIEELRKEIEELKEIVGKKDVELKEMREKEGNQGKSTEEMENTVKELRIALADSNNMRIALEEKCKVMDTAHSELLLSVELFRKQQESETTKLKLDLAASQHSLQAMRRTFGLI